jgi:hypothetical protein
MEENIQVCRRAESLLADVYKVPFHLEVLEQFESSHRVLRCAVQTEGVFPSTLIVKQRALDPPGKPGEFDQVVLFRNERASLDFLASLSDGAGPGPRRYASDRQAGLVVMEDLGAVQNVQDVLFGADRQAATHALVGLGHTLGQIQGMTSGHEAEFLTFQRELGAATTLSDASRDCRGYLDELHACMLDLGLKADEAFDQAIQDLESAIHGPGVWRTFVHHDAGPHNFVVTETGVRLLDFEFAGYGHGLLDIVCARLGYPPSFRGRIIPREVVRLMEESFQAELIRQAPELAGNLDFPQAMAQASIHWAFSKLIGFYSYLRERLLKGEAYDRRDGRDPARAAFLRRQVFTYLRQAQEGLEEDDRLPALRGTLSQIVGRLLQIWPETPLLDTYPAYGGEPWHYP